MVTLVGTQKSFADAIRNLIELDYDSIEAYEAAINRLSSEEYKQKLRGFKADHESHVKAFSELLRKHNEEVPSGPSAKQWLTKGKVVLAELMGDSTILLAMRTNEDDTNTAYQQMQNRDDKWEDAQDLIAKGLEDEKRHKAWFVEATK